MAIVWYLATAVTNALRHCLSFAEQILAIFAQRVDYLLEKLIEAITQISLNREWYGTDPDIAKGLC